MPFIDEEYCRALLAKVNPNAFEAEPGDSLPVDKHGEDACKQEDGSLEGSEWVTGQGPKQNVRIGDEKPLTAQDAFKRIIRLSRVRERNVQELRTRLAKEEYGEAVVEEALERAQSCGLVDDMRFAHMLINSRVRAGKGMMGIASELKRNGIDCQTVPGWPKEYFPESETEIDRALSLLQRKPPTSRNKREGAYRRLVSKGFSASVAGSAARLWSESSE